VRILWNHRAGRASRRYETAHDFREYEFRNRKKDFHGDTGRRGVGDKLVKHPAEWRSLALACR